MKTFRVRELAKKRRVRTHTALADASGINPVLAKQLWEDTADRPSLASLQKVAAFLGVTIPELYADFPQIESRIRMAAVIEFMESMGKGEDEGTGFNVRLAGVA